MTDHFPRYSQLGDYPEASGTYSNKAHAAPPVTLDAIRAACAGVTPAPPVAVRISVHPEAIRLLRGNVMTVAGSQPLAVQVGTCAWLDKHKALIEMSDGTFRTVDLRPRVKQSMHDCRGMVRGAFKRYKRARRAVDAYGTRGPYDLGVVMALDHAEKAAREKWLAAVDRLDAAFCQRGKP